MKNYTSIIIFIFLISCISAITLYAGDSTTIELEKPFEYYSVIGNNSEVILNITQDRNFVTITPSKYMSDDNFEIIFFDIEKEIIVEYHTSGSGGRTRYINNTERIDINNTKTIYVDKETGEEITQEVVYEQRTPIWTWIILLIVGCLMLYYAFRHYSNKYDIYN